MVKALPGARSGDTDARDTLVNAATGYIGLIRGHIRKAATMAGPGR